MSSGVLPYAGYFAIKGRGVTAHHGKISRFTNPTRLFMMRASPCNKTCGLAYPGCAGVSELEDELASQMRAAQAGDAVAYRRLLSALADILRRWVRRELARQGYEVAEAEDIVQETLLAIHLKRGSWDPDRAILPWLRAVTRHKLIDNLRRRGRRIMVPVDDVLETLAAPEPEATLSAEVLDRHLATLPPGQSQVVRAISIDGLSPSETAKKLTLSEGAVRVALHRGLAALSRAAQRSEQ
jgi:RNA polymerase sigma-70 factor (ECF subfamily)